MAEGRMHESWNHTASVMALIANVNRDPKRKPTAFAASDFNPFAKAGGGKKGIPLTKENFGLFKEAFTNAKKR